MAKTIPVPEFDDDDDRKRYFSAVATIKQELINSLVMIVFLSYAAKLGTGDMNFLSNLISKIIKKFRRDMISQFTGKPIEAKDPTIMFSDDPDVQRIMGDVLGENEADPKIEEIGDELIETALENVCEVYETVLQKGLEQLSEEYKRFMKFE